jgi:hypothetical protein
LERNRNGKLRKGSVILLQQNNSLLTGRGNFATQKVRWKGAQFHRLDAEVGNLPHMADACDESGNLAERDSSPGTTVPDHCSEGAAVSFSSNGRPI